MANLASERILLTDVLEDLSGKHPSVFEDEKGPLGPSPHCQVLYHGADRADTLACPV